MDAAASEFKPGGAGGGRDKISFESPSIVKLSEFKPQMRPPGSVPEFSPASRRLASAASAPEFKLTFGSGAIDALAESLSRKVSFESPSIARVSEFKPQVSSMRTNSGPFLSPAPYGAGSDGTCPVPEFCRCFLKSARPYSLTHARCRICLPDWSRAFITGVELTAQSVRSNSWRIIHLSRNKRWSLEPPFHFY